MDAITTEHTDTRFKDGTDPDERELILLDDLRHVIERLADAVEKQNELLEAELPTPEADR